MAHELEIANGKASMFFVGQVPWHGLGTKLEVNPTAEDAIRAAGLDWEVGLKSLVTMADFEKGTVEDGPLDKFARATFRKTDGKILGVVGPSWHPLQNADAFGFFDPFVATGEAEYETAGALRGGQRVWVLARLTDGLIPIVKNDDVRKYVLLSNSHDGTIAIRVGFTPIRVVCANTLAMSHASKESKLIRITHHAKANEALEKVREAMNLVNQAFEATADQYRALARTKCNDDDLKKYVNLVFAPKRVHDAAKAKAGSANSVEEFLASPEELEALTAGELRSIVYPTVQKLFEGGRGSDIPGVRGTLWGAYNAISEYIVHERGGDKKRETRLDSAWFGQGKEQNERALKVGLALAAA